VEAACRAVGRDPATLVFSVLSPVVLGTSEADVRDRVRDLLEISGDRHEPDQFIEATARPG
jgi:alkanesulfonate monooxygenase SsuD/methylene tetrahydromethanopterin reductase-like flavin-dependent oxidoreductase (luciferase family)